MKIFVIFAIVVACTYAAPMSELLHPSPVNPNVLVELKPAEKIILITDPQEMAKFKRETQLPLYPTMLPPEEKHHRAKREHQRVQETLHRDPLPLQKPQPTKKPSVNKRNRREIEPVKVTQALSTANAGHIVVEIYQKPPILPVSKEPIPHTTEANGKKPIENDIKQETAEVTTEKSSRPQGLPAIFSPSKKQKRDVSVSPVPIIHISEETQKNISGEKLSHECKTEELTHNEGLKTQNQHKRDIPVPLVPKYHHPEESSHGDNEKENNEAKKEENLENHHGLHHIQEHVSKEVFQKSQVLSAVVKKSNTEIHQQKRDISVSLVPEHNQKDSFKESNEKELNENNIKEVNSNNHQDLQKLPDVLPASGEKHVMHSEVRKPLVLPAISKETSAEIQQYESDYSVPLVPKNQHQEGSLKVNKMENQEIDDIQHDFQKFQMPIETQHKRDTLPEESSKHSNTMTSNGANKEIHVHEEIEKPLTMGEDKHDSAVPIAENQKHMLHSYQAQNLHQLLPSNNQNNPTAQNHQHIFPRQESIPKNIVSIPIIHKFQPKVHNENMPHFHQKLTGHNYHYVEHDKDQNPQDKSINLQNSQALPINNNVQNSQALPIHKQEHLTPAVIQEVLQKPQIMQAVTTESTSQNKREVLTSLETSQQSHKHKTEDEVQVEDLTERKPLDQINLHQTQPTHLEHNPNILDDHLGAYSSSSTTEHPVIRHKPVPVAELFARAHDN